MRQEIEETEREKERKRTKMAVADKSERYDRQLRLWGEEGQAKLERCKLCALGSGAAITETLKNLVLPGIGGFTVMDDALVQQADLGSNFFVDSTRLGESR